MTVSVQSKYNNQVCIITIERPERKNAVDGPTAAALMQAFLDFETDKDSKVAILTGKYIINGIFKISRFQSLFLCWC